MTADEIVAATRLWLGVPYRARGRSRLGIDCLGLLVMVGRHFAIPHSDELDYSLWPRSDLYITTKLGQHLEPWPDHNPQPGLIGVFAEQRLPCHVGIFSSQAGRIHVIHARIHPARVIEESWDGIPRRTLRLIKLFALPGMTR